MAYQMRWPKFRSYQNHFLSNLYPHDHSHIGFSYFNAKQLTNKGFYIHFVMLTSSLVWFFVCLIRLINNYFNVFVHFILFCVIRKLFFQSLILLATSCNRYFSTLHTHMICTTIYYYSTFCCRLVPCLLS